MASDQRLSDLYGAATPYYAYNIDGVEYLVTKAQISYITDVADTAIAEGPVTHTTTIRDAIHDAISNHAAEVSVRPALAGYAIVKIAPDVGDPVYLYVYGWSGDEPIDDAIFAHDVTVANAGTFNAATGAIAANRTNAQRAATVLERTAFVYYSPSSPPADQHYGNQIFFARTDKRRFVYSGLTIGGVGIFCVISALGAVTLGAQIFSGVHGTYIMPLDVQVVAIPSSAYLIGLQGQVAVLLQNLADGEIELAQAQAGAMSIVGSLADASVANSRAIDALVTALSAAPSTAADVKDIRAREVLWSVAAVSSLLGKPARLSGGAADAEQRPRQL